MTKVRPAIIIDNVAIFPDGRCRKMTLWERYLWWRGKLKTIKVKTAKYEFAD